VHGTSQKSSSSAGWETSHPATMGHTPKMLDRAG